METNLTHLLTALMCGIYSQQKIWKMDFNNDGSHVIASRSPTNESRHVQSVNEYQNKADVRHDSTKHKQGLASESKQKDCDQKSLHSIVMYRTVYVQN